MSESHGCRTPKAERKVAQQRTVTPEGVTELQLGITGRKGDVGGENRLLVVPQELSVKELEETGVAQHTGAAVR